MEQLLRDLGDNYAHAKREQKMEVNIPKFLLEDENLGMEEKRLITEAATEVLHNFSTNNFSYNLLSIAEGVAQSHTEIQKVKDPGATSTTNTWGILELIKKTIFALQQEREEQEKMALKEKQGIELEDGELTPGQKEEIIAYAEWVVDVLDQESDRSSISMRRDEIEDVVPVLSNDKAIVYNRKILKKTRNAFTLFSRALYETIQKQFSDSKSRIRISRKIDSTFLNSSDTFISLMDQKEKLKLAGIISMDPAFQGSYVPSMILSSEYDFAFASLDYVMEEIIGAYETSTPKEKFGVIRIFQEIVRSAAGNGYTKYSRLEEIVGIISNLKDRETNIILKQYISVIEKKMIAEIENPTGSIIQYKGDRGQGAQRISDNSDNEDAKKFFHKIGIVAESPESNYLAVPIAQGLIGLKDHAGFIQEIGFFEDSDELYETDKDLNVLDRGIDFIKNTRRLPLNNSKKIEFVSSLFPYLVTQKTDSDIDLSDFSDEEKRVFLSLLRGAEIENDIEEELKERALVLREAFFRNRNAWMKKNIESYIDTTSDMGKALVEGSKDVDEDDIFVYLDEAPMKLLSHEDKKRRYTSAFKPERPLEKFNKLQDDITNLYRGFQEYSREQEERGNDELNNLRDNLIAKNREYQESRDRIPEFYNKFLDKIVSHIDQIVQEEDDKLEKVHTSGGKYFFEQQPINPFFDTGKAESTFEMFQIMHKPEVRNQIEATFGIRLKEMTLAAQMEFLHFVLEMTPEQYDQLNGILQKEGIDRKNLLELFFATGGGDISIDEILEIAEHIDVDRLNNITASFGSSIGLLRDLDESINIYFEKQKDEILKVPVLQQMHKKIVSLLKKDLTAEKDAPLFLEEEAREATVGFCAIFKQVFSQKEKVDFSEIKNVSLQSTKTKDLSEKDKKEMLEIFEANWASKDSFHIQQVEYFRSLLEGEHEDDDWDILKKDGNIVGYMRFAPVDKPGVNKPHVYGGSFNVHPKYASSAIGKSLVEVVQTKAEMGYVIEATAEMDKPVLYMYVESWGSVITGVEHDALGSGASLYTVEIDLEKNKQYRYKDKEEYSNDVLAQMVGKDKNIEVVAVGDETIFDGRIGQVVTRCIPHPSDSSKRIIAWEAN